MRGNISAMESPPVCETRGNVSGRHVSGTSLGGLPDGESRDESVRLALQTFTWIGLTLKSRFPGRVNKLPTAPYPPGQVGLMLPGIVQQGPRP